MTKWVLLAGVTLALGGVLLAGMTALVILGTAAATIIEIGANAR